MQIKIKLSEVFNLDADLFVAFFVWVIYFNLKNRLTGFIY